MKRFRMAGVEKVSKNITKAIQEEQLLTQKGLIRAAIAVRRDMDKTSPITPVDTRNLDHSFYIVTPKRQVDKGGSFEGANAGKLASEHTKTMEFEQMKVLAYEKPAIGLGFTANYAAFVHEAPPKTKFKRPGSGRKFFESALERNRDTILQILREETGIIGK